MPYVVGEIPPPWARPASDAKRKRRSPGDEMSKKSPSLGGSTMGL